MVKPDQVKDRATDRHTWKLLEFGKTTLKLLRNDDDWPDRFGKELETNLRLALACPPSKFAAQCAIFDELGVDLWNTVTTLIQVDIDKSDSTDLSGAQQRMLVLVRTFAFALLDAAYHARPAHKEDADRGIRLFKISLKAARLCLDHNELEIALQVLEKCSVHITDPESDSPLIQFETDDQGAAQRRRMVQSLTAEFYLFRVTHAWKSNQLDLADYFFRSFSQAHHLAAAELSEKAVDLFLEIGKSLCKKGATGPAVQWLERAHAQIEQVDVLDLTHDIEELRLIVSAGLVDALTSTTDPENIARAKQLVEALRGTSHFDNRMTLHLMQLNILFADDSLDTQSIRDVIVKMALSAVLTEKSFKIIMQCIHRVRKHDLCAACHALTTLIVQRLLYDLDASAASESETTSWVEKCCVTFTMFTADAPEGSIETAMGSLVEIFDTVANSARAQLSSEAIHAAQTLIWRASNTEDRALGRRWTVLLQHPIFDGAGDLNKAKIARKCMSSAMEVGDLVAARETFFEMPSTVQDETASRYLAFKLALRLNDHDFAVENLEVLLRHCRGDHTYLYACVLEAQQSEMPRVAVAALQALLDQRPPDIHLPSLLRCTARLMIGELQSQDGDPPRIMEEIVQVFENAASNIRAIMAGCGDQWPNESRWWSKNAYNLGLRVCGTINPALVVRLLQVCVAFIEHYPPDAGPMLDDKLSYRKGLCHFLSAVSLIALGRSAHDDPDEGLQRYEQARQQIRAFKATNPASTNEQPKDRMFELLKLDLECVLRLHQWDDLRNVLQACIDYDQDGQWDALADLVFIIHGELGSFNEQMMTLMQKIINRVWKRDRDLNKVSRWLRLSYSIDVSNGSGAFALQLLQQAASIAKNGYDKVTDPYPEAELQWLASMGFNRAVDLLGRQDIGEARTWIEAALELARYACDEGNLHRCLTLKKNRAKERIAEL